MKKRNTKYIPASLPITLNRKQIYILPTRYGYLFIILLLSMLIGSINYNNNFGFLLTFILGSMGILSIYYTFIDIAGIVIVSAYAVPVFAGGIATFELVVRVKTLDRFSINFQFLDKGEEIPEDLFVQEDKLITRSIKSYKRGILKPGALLISTVYPFGIFRAWSTVMPDLQCVVYPKPIDSSYELAEEPSRNNGTISSSRPGVEDFQGLAAYQPGDQLQHISWKKYSQGQGLYTKKFEGKTGATGLIDWFSLKGSDMEKKLSLMSGMIMKAYQANMEYGLRLPGITIESGSGRIHKNNCLKSLALFQLPGPDGI